MSSHGPDRAEEYQHVFVGKIMEELQDVLADVIKGVSA